MRTVEYLLFRLNFVDRVNLFSNPVRTDSQIEEVVGTATEEKCDLVRSRSRSGSRWSLRQAEADSLPTLFDRRFISVIFSHEATYREGPIVTAHGISRGVSEISPPAATTAHVVIDLQRHIVAIQDVPAIMRVRRAWKNDLELILNAAARWRDYSSRISLEPIAPRQIVEGRLALFRRITRIRVTLRIPNPDLGPTFQRLYEQMSEGGVRELTEDMRSERGLNLESDSLPKATLDMALSGYRKGDIRVYGYKTDDEKDKYTIGTDVARIEVEGLRDYVSGVAEGSRTQEVRRVAEQIIRRIDDLLPNRRVDE